MNILDVQDKLKHFSEQQLVGEMQAPSGQAPQFLVLSEITRRKRMRDEMASKAQQGPQSTVAQEAVAAAGVPQGGIGQMAQTMAPKSDITQNTGIGALPQAPVQGMAEGGRVGDNSYPSPPLAFLRDPAVQALAARQGVRPGELWRQMTPELRAAQEQRLAVQDNVSRYPVTRGDYLDQITAEPGVNPSYDPVAAEQGTRQGFIMPEQADLDRDYADSITPYVTGFGSPPTETAAQLQLPGISASSQVSGMPPLDLDLVGDSLPSYDMRGQLTQLDASALPTAGLPMPGPTPRDLLMQSLPDRLTPLPKPRERELMSIAEALGPGAGSPGMTRTPEVLQLEREDLEARKDADMSFSKAPPSFFERLLNTSPDPEVAQRLTERTAEANELRQTADGEAVADGEAAADAETDAAETDATETYATETYATGAPPAGGGGPMSSYEQELVEAIKRSEKRATQDKWLALAQAGMALMSSKEPTLGGALGEAGMAGLGAFRGSRDASEEQKMKLLEAQFGAQMARQQMAQRAAAASRSGGAKPPSISALMQLSKGLGDQLESLTDGMGQPTMANQQAFEAIAAQKRQVDSRLFNAMGIPPAGSGGGGVDFQPQ